MLPLRATLGREAHQRFGRIQETGSAVIYRARATPPLSSMEEMATPREKKEKT